MVNGQQLSARLDHLGLTSHDPTILARFYAERLGMSSQRLGDGYLCRGRERCLIFTEGKPNGLAFAAYRVRDRRVLEGLAARLRNRDIVVEPGPSPLLEPDAVAFRDPSGNLVVFGVPIASPPIESAMPARLQHLVVASRDAAAMAVFYSEVIGLRVSDQVLDNEGGLRTCFMRTDDEHHSLAIFQASEDRLDHFCFESRDWNSIRDWGDHFASQNTQIEWGPGRHGPGNNLFIFIHDPDKNWVEISAELEIVAADRPAGTWPHNERTLNLWGRAPLRS